MKKLKKGLEFGEKKNLKSESIFYYILHNYARRFHCGLVLTGGFVEHEVPDLQTIISYDLLGELNAGNF